VSASDQPNNQASARTIRVMLVDDHPVVRTGLRGMLAAEPDIEVTAEAGSGPEAVALACRGGFDVILMDLRMPGGDGVTATAAIHARDSARVVVLTTYDTDTDILRAVEAGASGYLLKDATQSELAGAVRAAARGETVLAPSVAGRLVTRLREPRTPLSARETEILAGAARGLTNAEIGRELFISEATVKTHLLRACGKLGVTGRTAAVATALDQGILRPAPPKSAPPGSANAPPGSAK
jgi:DNA-binding NarL/FixJ family response regulator